MGLRLSSYGDSVSYSAVTQGARQADLGVYVSTDSGIIGPWNKSTDDSFSQSDLMTSLMTPRAGQNKLPERPGATPDSTGAPIRALPNQGC